MSSITLGYVVEEATKAGKKINVNTVAFTLGFVAGRRYAESKAQSKQPIPTRTCGDGFTVPCVGVGCWSFGCKEGEYWGERKQEATNDIVRAALEYGTAFFDTAEAYQNGRSEEALCAALKAAGPLAKGAVLTSKILPGNCSPEGNIRTRLEASLERMGVKNCYLYQVHWPIPPNENKRIFAELAALQKEGLIKHIGVSNFGVEQLTEALSTGVKIATNQLCYNLVTRAIEIEIAPLCAKHNIGIICYSPLLQGLLTDKGVAVTSFDELPVPRCRTRHFKGSREMSRHGGPGHEDVMMQTLKEVAKIAAEAKVPVHQLAMQWCLSNPQVVCVIPGARNRSQLEANMKAAEPLPAAIKTRLDKATQELKDRMGSALDIYESDAKQRVH